VDPELQVAAVERASELILDIAGGSAGPVIEELSSQHLPDTPAITLRLDRINHLLGTELGAAEVEDILTRLGMQVGKNPDGFQVQPPPARRDLAVEVDLIEEVARLVGYDRLPSREPGGRLRASVASERSVATDKLHASLHARGFQEIMTWSFVARDELARLGLDATAQPLANPLSQEMSVLRTSLLPGLLRIGASNLRHQQSRLKLFETGHVFSAGSQWLETERLGLLLAGDADPESWLGTRREFDFFDLKGEIEHLVGCAGHRVEALRAAPVSDDWMHPGQAAALTLDGRELGVAGQLHPGIATDLDLGTRVFVAELDLEILRQRKLPEFAGTARYPSVRRDLALIVPEAVPAAELVEVCRKAAARVLERCIIFDMYRGKGIESGYKSIGIGLILRDVSRTLTDEEVDSVMLSVIEALKKECQISLRG